MISKSIQTKYPSIRDWGGKTVFLRRLVDEEDKKWSAFNPSIGYSPKHGYAMTIRSSNYVLNTMSGLLDITHGGTVKNRLWFAELDQTDLSIKAIKEVQFSTDAYPQKRGVEDAKLFWKDDSWYFSAVMLEREHTVVGRICLYKYDQETNTASLVHRWAGPDVFRIEKNWMFPYGGNDNFDCVYNPTSVIKNDKLISTLSEQTKTGGLRGSSNLWKLDDGTYIGIMHTVYIKSTPVYNPRTFGNSMNHQRRYTHQFVKVDEYGAIVGLSNEFVFENLDIEFAAGLVEKDGNYIISYGAKDVTSHLAIVPVEQIHSRILPIDDVEINLVVSPIT